MKRLTILWKRLSYTGTTNIRDPDLYKRVVLSNQLSIISGLPIIFYTLLAPDKFFYVGVMLLAACISFSAILLNQQGYHNLARIAVILAPQIGTLAGVYMLFGLSERNEYYVKFTIIATFILPMVLISIRERWLMAIGTGIVIANFFGSEFLGTRLFYPIYESEEMPPNALYVISALVNFTMFFLGFGYLQHINLTSEDNIVQLLRDTQLANEELAQLTHNLQAKQHRLDLINRKLANIIRAKTKDLTLRNKQLQEYGEFHAHQVRAPLARIMGLVLVLQKTDRNDPQELEYCLNRLNEAALELDAIMKAFNRRLEEEVSLTASVSARRELLRELADLNRQITETNELLYLEVVRLQRENQRLREER
ncbi:hypothetical protein [Rhodoflexus caldus]|uniref:hypothetical protein n=1 Tax=Rhodoflexus caldus TaxID=2891236 RepID=UPI002029EB78|nr:hypothetical protein [Rhodoflexus caldus]